MEWYFLVLFCISVITNGGEHFSQASSLLRFSFLGSTFSSLFLYFSIDCSSFLKLIHQYSLSILDVSFLFIFCHKYFSACGLSFHQLCRFFLNIFKIPISRIENFPCPHPHSLFLLGPPPFLHSGTKHDATELTVPRSHCSSLTGTQATGGPWDSHCYTRTTYLDQAQGSSVSFQVSRLFQQVFFTKSFNITQ